MEALVLVATTRQPQDAMLLARDTKQCKALLLVCRRFSNR
jgi:hypothetical protein